MCAGVFQSYTKDWECWNYQFNFLAGCGSVQTVCPFRSHMVWWLTSLRNCSKLYRLSSWHGCGCLACYYPRSLGKVPAASRGPCLIWSFVPRHPFVTFAWVCQSVFIFSVYLSDVHCSSSVFNLTNFSVAMISLTNAVVLVRVFIAAMKQKMGKKTA